MSSSTIRDSPQVELRTSPQVRFETIIESTLGKLSCEDDT